MAIARYSRKVIKGNQNLMIHDQQKTPTMYDIRDKGLKLDSFVKGKNKSKLETITIENNLGMDNTVVIGARCLSERWTVDGGQPAEMWVGTIEMFAHTPKTWKLHEFGIAGFVTNVKAVSQSGFETFVAELQFDITLWGPLNTKWPRQVFWSYNPKNNQIR